MTKDEALRLALEALEEYTSVVTSVNDPNTWVKVADGGKPAKEAITAIKAALEAKDEPVPVAIVEVFGKDWRLDYMALPVGKHKLYAQQYTYTTPPQRKPLTDEEIDAILIGLMRQHKSGAVTIARAIEAAHGIKGEA